MSMLNEFCAQACMHAWLLYFFGEIDSNQQVSMLYYIIIIFWGN